MASTPHFWLMYVMMTMVATGGFDCHGPSCPHGPGRDPDGVDSFRRQVQCAHGWLERRVQGRDAFDVMAAVLAFFVLRKMQAPYSRPHPSLRRWLRRKVRARSELQGLLSNQKEPVS
jgi:hypothetical protein